MKSIYVASPAGRQNKNSSILILPLDICCQDTREKVGLVSFSRKKQVLVMTANEIFMLSQHIVSFTFLTRQIKISKNVNLKRQNPKHIRNPNFLKTWAF